MLQSGLVGFHKGTFYIEMIYCFVPLNGVPTIIVAECTNTIFIAKGCKISSSLDFDQSLVTI